MTTYIYHHGIIGMHWGIRRYQPYPKNYSGSGKEVGEAKRKGEKVTVLKTDIVKPIDRDSRSTKIAKETVKRVKAEKRAEKKAIKAVKKQVKIEKRTQKAIAKLEKEKKRILTKGTPEEVLKFAENLTLDELNTAYNRFVAQKKIKELVPEPPKKLSRKEVKAQQKKEAKRDVDKARANVDAFFKELKTINSYMDVGLKTYSNVKKVQEAMKGKNIETDEDKDKKEKDKKKS